MPELQVPQDTVSMFGDANKVASPFNAAPGDIRDLPGRREALVDFLTLGPASAIAGFIDTVGQSINVLDTTELEEWLKANAGGIGRYYSDKKAGAQTVGDLAGLFVPGMGALKLYRSASAVAKGISGGKRSAFLESILLRAGKYEKEIEDLRRYDEFLIQNRALDVTKDSTRRRLARKAIGTKITDVIKENIAFELGLFAFMNDSQTLYPDEFSTVELLAMNSALPLTFAVGAGALAKREIRRSVEAAGKFVESVRNSEGLPTNQLLLRDENLHVAVTVEARERNLARDLKTEATTELGQTVDTQMRKGLSIAQENLSRQITVLDGSIKDNIERLFRVTPFEGVTVSTKPSAAQVKTIQNVLDRDESGVFGVASFETMPIARSDLVAKLESKTKALSKMEGTVKNYQVDINKLLDKGEDASDLLRKRDELRKKMDDLRATEFVVFEPNGNVSIASTRKPIYQDIEGWSSNIHPTPATATESKSFNVTAPADPLYQTRKRLIGVTDDFILVSPPPETGAIEKTIISNVNVTQILPREKLRDPEFFRELLHDIAEDWHPVRRTTHAGGSDAPRNRGHEIYKELSNEAQTAVSRWIRSSHGVRHLFQPEAAIGSEIFNAYAPLRKRLAEIADSDGTIPLYRGERKAETANPKNDIVSMTSSPGVAKDFAGTDGNIIVRRVPIDDVIMVIGGAGDEFEYVVKGNLKRRAQGTKTTVTSGEGTAHTFEEFSLLQRTAAYGAFQKAIDDIIKNPGKFADRKITVSAGDHHTRLDALLELETRRPGSIAQIVQLPSNVTNIDDLAFMSINSKYKEFFRVMEMMKAVRSGVLKVPEDKRILFSDLPKMFNLPGTSTGEAHPLLQIFQAAYAENIGNLGQIYKDLDSIKMAMAGRNFTRRLTPVLQPEEQFRLRGDMMNMSTDAQPVLGIIRNTGVNAEDTRVYLTRALQNERSRVFSEMAQANGKSGAGFVELIFKDIMSRPDMFREIKEGMLELLEGQQLGRGLVTQQPFAAGTAPAITAMHNETVLSEKIGRKYMERRFAQRLIPALNQLRHPNNSGDLTSFNLYMHGRRQGWQVEPEPVALGEGRWGLKLKDTNGNRKRWREFFGRELNLEDEALMPATVKFDGKFYQYEPMGMSELAMETAKAVDDMGFEILQNSNFLRKLMGRGEVRRRDWWVPPLNFGRGEKVFIMNSATDEVITVVSEPTKREAERKAEQIIQNLGYNAHKLDNTDVERYFDIKDKVFERMIGFDDPFAQTGPGTGKSVGGIINVGEQAVTDVTTSLRLGYESLMRRTRAVVFEPEIQFARKRHAMAATEGARANLDVYQSFIANVFGNQTINPNQILGHGYLAVERYYDNVIAAGFDRAASFFRGTAVGEAWQKMRADKTFKRVQEQLGPYNPFRDTVDFMEQTHKVRAPANMKKHMARLNALASMMTLRLFETGHSLLTMTSLAATMPAVVQGLKRLPGEDPATFARRIGAWGVQIEDEIAMWSPTKAIINGMHFMFSKEGRKLYKEFSDEGFMDQQVAEIFKTITSVEQGYYLRMANRATEFASFLSDNAEKLARGVSFMTGYKYGQDVLGLEGGTLKAFAHHFANQVIGDYSPNARPRIFQGAAGMPLGLFMTFMTNYYQRLFNYIENGQTRALAVQFATQAAVFGGETIPGWQQYNDRFLTNYDGSANPVDAMNNRFGPEFTEWFMNGIISNLPKMFGMDGGVALSTRGDVNFRNVPTIFTPGDTPIFSMFRDFVQGTRETFGRLRQTGRLTTNDLAEIAQSYATNRAIRNISSLYTGYTSDRRGQVIAESPSFGDIIRGEVENEVALIARGFGLRTIEEKNRAYAAYKNRSIDLSRQLQLGYLRRAYRTGIRANDGQITDDMMERTVSEYVRLGYSPENFANWITENWIASKVDKNSLQLMRWIDNPQRSDNVLRLMHSLGADPPSATIRQLQEERDQLLQQQQRQ